MLTKEHTSPIREDEDEEGEDDDQAESHLIDETPLIISEQYEIKEEVPPPVNMNQLQIPVQTDSSQFSRGPSVTSTATPVQPSIRVEINGKMDPPSARRSKSRLEQSAKTSSTEQANQKRYFHKIKFSLVTFSPFQFFTGA